MSDFTVPDRNSTGSSGSSEKKETTWENPYDKLYNLTEKINEALRQREKLAEKGETPHMVRRGEIYYADLSPVVGSEQGGVRPVLIVQNDLGNLTSPTVIVAPLTSRSKKKTLRTHVTVDPPEGGLSRPSQVLCEQVRTLEKSRLSLYLGRLSADTLRRVDEALEQALGTRR